MKKTSITILFLTVLCMMIISTSCQTKSYEAKEKPVEVYFFYDFSVSDDMLDYFDITAHYLNPALQYTSVKMDDPGIYITTSTDTLPTERKLQFTVTRKGNIVPPETPNWETNLDITIDKVYKSGERQTERKNINYKYTPDPAKFDEWAESFIYRMGVGYETFVTFDGRVNYSY